MVERGIWKRQSACVHQELPKPARRFVKLFLSVVNGCDLRLINPAHYPLPASANVEDIPLQGFLEH